MQTLTSGSFLKFENEQSVERLKFTARRLAEMTASVAAAGNFDDAALENLARQLWDKAAYVTLDVERRRLREIFLENFSERFRELKPKVAPAENSVSEVLLSASAIENSGLIVNAPAPEETEGRESEWATDESASSVALQPEAKATEAEAERDEFLGFVKTDEPFAAAPIAKSDEATTTAPDEAEPENEAVAETSKSENKSAIARDATNSENRQAAAEGEVSAKNPSDEKLPLPAPASGNDSPATSANKNGTNQTMTAKEPFEFGKCTVNFNLVLLPSSGDAKSRKAIVSAMSHNSPPEIEFLEIGSGEDLIEIAELVRDKLARFKQTLPAKYIEQLRTSKTQSAKKLAPAKTQTAVAAPTKSAINQPNVEKTSGSPTAQFESKTENEKSRAEITATKETAEAKLASVAAVLQSVPANNVQPSLF